MYETTFVHRHPKDRLDQHLSELKTRIVPLVKQQPGFRSGTWSFDEVASRSYSHLIWDSAEAAQRFLSFLRAQAAQGNPFGIELDSATMNPVLVAT